MTRLFRWLACAARHLPGRRDRTVLHWPEDYTLPSHDIRTNFVANGPASSTSAYSSPPTHRQHPEETP